MLYAVLCLSLASGASSTRSDEGSIESDLIKSLTNDANLDLPVDEEYEDLRAELLAYHTALASLVESVNNDTARNGQARRNIRSKPCWEQGGICVRRYLCEGHRYVHQVPGCKDQRNVCCFAWNNYRVRDQQGIAGPGYPWSLQREPFRGQGVVFNTYNLKPKKKKPKKPKIAQMTAEDSDYHLNGFIKPKKLISVRRPSENLAVIDLD